MEQIIITYFSKISDEISLKIRHHQNLLWTSWKVIWAFLFDLIIAIPYSACLILIKIISWQNYFLWFFLNWLAIFFYIIPYLRSQYKKDIKTPLLFWIEIPKIAKYIIENWKFPRDDVSRYFWISRAAAQEIIDKLDEVKIFVRWNNNSRVPDNSLGESEIVKRLITSPTDDHDIEKNNENYIENQEVNAVQATWLSDDEDEANYNWFTRRPLAKQ
jgi:hypothetical protein